MALQKRVWDVLVAAAHLPELAGIVAALGADRSGVLGGVTVAARPLGVGLVASAAGAAALLARERARTLVLVGTCGVYPGRAVAPIGSAVVAGTVRLVDLGAVLSGASEVPSAVTTARGTEGSVRAGVARGLPVVDVATTLGVTVSDAAAASLGRTGLQVEHMEAFAVAEVCAAEGVAFAAVLGVSNVVGSSARAEWRTHRVAAAESAARHVREWLEAGAPGAARAEGV